MDDDWYVNGILVEQPKDFGKMEAWLEYLNSNEDLTYQLIHDIDGFIEFIDNPSDKQMRGHQMRWVI